MNTSSNESIGSGIADLFKISTLTDGGARIQLDLGSDSRELIQSLINIKMGDQAPVLVAFVEYNPDGN